MQSPWPALVDADSAITPDKLGTAHTTITSGAVITASDWRTYQKFIPDGMVALFDGKSFVEDGD